MQLAELLVLTNHRASSRVLQGKTGGTSWLIHRAPATLGILQIYIKLAENHFHVSGGAVSSFPGYLIPPPIYTPGSCSLVACCSTAFFFAHCSSHVGKHRCRSSGACCRSWNRSSDCGCSGGAIPSSAKGCRQSNGFIGPPRRSLRLWVPPWQSIKPLYIYKQNCYIRLLSGASGGFGMAWEWLLRDL